MDPVNEAFGRSLRRRRTGQRLSMTALGERAGVAPHTISLLESGKSGTGLDTAWRLAAALGTTLDAMTAGAEGHTRAGKDGPKNPGGRLR